jgi:hypothetical protein
MAANAKTKVPLTSSARLNGRIIGMDGTKSDKDSLVTYAIELRQQHRVSEFAETYLLYTRGEEGAPVLGGIEEDQLVAVDTHVVKGTSWRTVIVADKASALSEIERFERMFELTGLLEECETTRWEKGDLAELTISGLLGQDEVSVCVKAFEERVELAEGIELDKQVRVTGRVTSREQDGQRLNSLHLDTIEVVS